MRNSFNWRRRAETRTHQLQTWKTDANQTSACNAVTPYGLITLRWNAEVFIRLYPTSHLFSLLSGPSSLIDALYVCCLHRARSGH
jgi:hypothetical protein